MSSPACICTFVFCILMRARVPITCLCRRTKKKTDLKNSAMPHYTLTRRVKLSARDSEKKIVKRATDTRNREPVIPQHRHSSTIKTSPSERCREKSKARVHVNGAVHATSLTPKNVHLVIQSATVGEKCPQFSYWPIRKLSEKTTVIGQMTMDDVIDTHGHDVIVDAE